MRVISGNYKGKTLKAVPGMKTRPTSDKVKEALFHRIGPYFEGGDGLDLYAGTGNLGVEAISRGMDSFVFVDKSPQSVKIIKQNLKSIGIQEQTEVYCNDAARSLSALGKRNKTFNMIFMDPPYHINIIPELLESIAAKGLLIKSGIVICEHHSSSTLADKIGILTKQSTERYGDTSVSVYEREQ
ncbi:16S rRNA (guanine(966)-N(2))-methyltransferase RsmD [Salibacterium salarium]|uniref:16S rRNA (Guanine(966)-N(2))-methyltransferase RsmD n=1 Tax=Salibacterium salarium TaxID=284579 RepID=A0A428MU55_9BACI|nr:16S rRNA (guanine(966)-N(2))-methyltransferase RsmD [Salibacterium salarium]RSL29606.1 16S rRNA (guanine(966)-N(2))-methyltransferase RsmD [Salibacterium salarium]